MWRLEIFTSIQRGKGSRAEYEHRDTPSDLRCSHLVLGKLNVISLNQFQVNNISVEKYYVDVTRIFWSRWFVFFHQSNKSFEILNCDSILKKECFEE